MPKDWCENDAIEGIEASLVDKTFQPVAPQPINPGDYAMLNLTPMLSILNSGKMLPLAFAPMQLELTLADGADFLMPGTTGSYSIETMSIRASLLRLDSAVQASFANLLMQNRALPIALNTVHTQVVSVPRGASSIDVQAVRAFSRLNALFVSFLKHDNSGLGSHNGISFHNPSLKVGDAANNGYVEHTMRWQVQIGSKLTPEAPATSTAETFSILRSATGVIDESVRTLNLTAQSYKSSRFVIGVPLQTVQGMPFSGLNTRSGDLLTFRASNIDPGANGTGDVSKVVLTFVNSSIVEIRESGTQLLD